MVGGAAGVPTCMISAIPGRMRGPSHHCATTCVSTVSSSENKRETASQTLVQPTAHMHSGTTTMSGFLAKLNISVNYSKNDA